jgi:hypothetical protein
VICLTYIMFKYRAFGINISSEFLLPELIPTESEEEVIIVSGTVPEKIENPKSEGVCYQASPGTFLLNIKDVARYLVTNGSEIIIETYPNAQEDDVRLFLLGSCFGALLHQRGYLPFHGSVINIRGKAIIFSGVSGSGKSTLAGAFQKKGYPILSDDVANISMDESHNPFVHPSYPQIKLWKDSLLKLGEEPELHLKLRKKLDKYGVHIHESYFNESLPLAGIYILIAQNTGKDEIDTVIGIEKFNALRKNTYRYTYLAGLDLNEQHFKTCTRIAPAIRVKRITRSTLSFSLDNLVELVEKDILSWLE